MVMVLRAAEDIPVGTKIENKHLADVKLDSMLSA